MPMATPAVSPRILTPRVVRIAVTGSLLLPHWGFGQQSLPDVTITPVRGGVSVVRIAQPDGTTIGANAVLLATTDGSYLIDTNLPVPPLTGLLRRSVEQAAVGRLSRVVVTHWHPDHSGGIAGFSTDVPVAAHVNVQRRLSEATEGVDLVRPGSRFTASPRPPAGLPTEVLTDSVVWQVGAETVTAVHYARSHTDGDLVVFFREADVVAMGDLYWPGAFPSIDIVNGGTAVGLMTSLEAILERTSTNTRFVSGHGPVTDRTPLEEAVAMLHATIGQVRERKALGASLATVQTDGLDGDWSSWETPLVPEAQWIKLIYESLPEA